MQVNFCCVVWLSVLPFCLKCGWICNKHKKLDGGCVVVVVGSNNSEWLPPPTTSIG